TCQVGRPTVLGVWRWRATRSARPRLYCLIVWERLAAFRTADSLPRRRLPPHFLPATRTDNLNLVHAAPSRALRRSLAGVRERLTPSRDKTTHRPPESSPPIKVRISVRRPLANASC